LQLQLQLHLQLPVLLVSFRSVAEESAVAVAVAVVIAVVVALTPRATIIPPQTHHKKPTIKPARSGSICSEQLKLSITGLCGNTI
jgi:hypothetical protein